MPHYLFVLTFIASQAEILSPSRRQKGGKGKIGEGKERKGKMLNAGKTLKRTTIMDEVKEDKRNSKEGKRNRSIMKESPENNEYSS